VEVHLLELGSAVEVCHAVSLVIEMEMRMKREKKQLQMSMMVEKEVKKDYCTVWLQVTAVHEHVWQRSLLDCGGLLMRLPAPLLATSETVAELHGPGAELILVKTLVHHITL
jgi:hypothetical protein